MDSAIPLVHQPLGKLVPGKKFAGLARDAKVTSFPAASGCAGVGRLGAPLWLEEMSFCFNQGKEKFQGNICTDSSFADPLSSLRNAKNAPRAVPLFPPGS